MSFKGGQKTMVRDAGGKRELYASMGIDEIGYSLHEMRLKALGSGPDLLR